MKRVFTLILIAVLLLTPCAVCSADSYVTNSQSVFDYAGTLGSTSAKRLDTTLLNYSYDLNMYVFIYRFEYEYNRDYNEIKQRRCDHVSLFIKVNGDGEYIESFVKYKDYYEILPSEDMLLQCHNNAALLFRSGDFYKGIGNFFRYVYNDIDFDKIDSYYEYDEREWFAEKTPEAKYYPLYLGFFISLIVGMILGGLRVKRLKKQLKTVEYSKDATRYINSEYVSIRSERQDRGLLDLF